MSKHKEIKIDVIHQGAPIVNSAHILKRGKDMIAIHIDLKSKHCYFSGSTGGDNSPPGVWIAADESSLQLHHEFDVTEPTKIEFPEFKGWDVFACNIYRYTAYLCLICKDNE